MTACDIQIILDRKDATYNPNETISGVVSIQVKEDDFDCSRLLLWHRWQFHRKGKLIKRSGDVLVLADNMTCQVGRDCRFPFELDAPIEPPTFRGDNFQVKHSLQVKAKRKHLAGTTASIRSRLSKTPKAEITFTLIDEHRHHKIQNSHPIDITMSSQVGPVFGKAFLSIIIGSILGNILSISPKMMIVFIFLLLLGFSYRLYISTFLAGLRLERAIKYRRPKVDAIFEVVEPDNMLKCQLQIRPKGRLEPVSSSLKLSVREEYDEEHTNVEGDTSKDTTKHDIYKDKVKEYLSIPVDDGQTFRYELVLQLPDGLLPSSYAGDYRIVWEASIKVNLKNWFDWHQSYTIYVS